MTNGRVVHCWSSRVLVGFLTLIVGNCLVSSMALGGEFHFVVHDVEGDAAAWSLREVAFHTSTDFEGD
jgi:hypothetical protein